MMPTPAFDTVLLDTARLQLRPLRAADADDLLAIHADPEVMRYSNTRPWASIDQAHAMLDRDHRGMAAGSHLCLGIVPTDDARVVGTCTLFGLNRASRRAELGFALGRPAWGRGWMGEALRAFVAFGFERMDLNRIEADIDPGNLASARTLERLGFQYEGLLRERWIVDGEVSDTAFYGLLRSGWAPAPLAGQPSAGREAGAGLRVERLTADHAPQYRSLMLQAYRMAADAFTSTPEERAAETDAWWFRRIADPAGGNIAFGAFSGDELVGTVGLEFSAKPKTRHKVLLIGMYVQAEHRGRGAGRALVAAAVEHARSVPGAKAISLTVTGGNEPAIALYRAFGFRPFGTEPMAILTPGGFRSKLHMWKPLESLPVAPGSP